eukprot:1151275-Pelagomonas_calceolata.AAC.1
MEVVHKKVPFACKQWAILNGKLAPVIEVMDLSMHDQLLCMNGHLGFLITIKIRDYGFSLYSLSCVLNPQHAHPYASRFQAA